MLKLINYLSLEEHGKRKFDELSRAQTDRTASTNFGTVRRHGKAKVQFSGEFGQLQLSDPQQEAPSRLRANRVRLVVVDLLP